MSKKKTRLGLLPDGTPFHCINKMEMLFCYKEIFDQGAYESPLINFKDGDIIMDVGANIGLFIHYVSRHCSQTKIFAFEPIPRICKALDLNAQAIKNSDVHVIPCGLSDQPGEATFIFLRNATARSTMFPEYSPTNTSAEGQSREVGFMLQTFKEVPNAPLRFAIAVLPPFLRRGLARAAVKFHAQKRTITCQLKTISQIIEENSLPRIDLIKIDVEGAERQVLGGIREEHWPLIRQFIIETHPGPGDVLSDVKRAMESHGFRTTTSDQTLHPAPTVFASRI